MLSALARWPTNRIAAMWVGAAMWLAVLAVLGALANKRTWREFRETTGTSTGASAGTDAPALTPQARDSQEALAFAALKVLTHDSALLSRVPEIQAPSAMTAEQRDSLLTSLGVTERLSANQRDSVPHLRQQLLDSLAAVIVPGMRSVAPVLMLSLVVVCSVPAIVCGLTFAWLIARWRHPSSAPPAAA
jgi:hypothetical protein